MLPLFSPFVTLVGHVGQQEFQHHLLTFLRAQTLTQHLKARRDMATATGGQRSFAFDFHHTCTAIAICTHALFVAKVRNVNAMALSRIENRLTFKTHHGLIIELEFNTGWHQQFFGHRGVHLNDLLWKILLNTPDGVRRCLTQTADGCIRHHLVQIL